VAVPSEAIQKIQRDLKFEVPPSARQTLLEVLTRRPITSPLEWQSHRRNPTVQSDEECLGNTTLPLSVFLSAGSLAHVTVLVFGQEVEGSLTNFKGPAGKNASFELFHYIGKYVTYFHRKPARPPDYACANGFFYRFCPNLTVFDGSRCRHVSAYCLLALLMRDPYYTLHK
jgi:hypothetical protein